MAHVFVGLGILRLHIGLRDATLQCRAPSGRGDDTHGLAVGVGQHPAARMGGAIQEQPHATELGALGQLKEELLPAKHQMTALDEKNSQHPKTVQKPQTFFGYIFVGYDLCVCKVWLNHVKPTNFAAWNRCCFGPRCASWIDPRSTPRQPGWECRAPRGYQLQRAASQPAVPAIAYF